MACAATAAAAAAEKPLFGSKQFDVVERHGTENRYQETFSATEDVYLIKLQNGEIPKERSA